jgi:hypothetical protein
VWIERFLARLQQPRTARPVKQNLPAPLGVIGAFTMLIGALVTVLGALPQSTLNRVVTGVAALALLGGGWLMRRQSRLAAATTERVIKATSAL